MSSRLLATLGLAAPLASAILLSLALFDIWAARLPYPFDLEWMEGGMLAHAWRISQGLPIYVEPNPDFVPYIYPPGYSALVALLGAIFGLAPPLGRVVSLAGTIAAALAAAFVVAKDAETSSARTEEWPAVVPAFVAAATFLGTYPATGAFFDLVRPDGLFIGLLAWSIAIALQRYPSAPVVSGLLLFLSFSMKHNAAAFGPALLLHFALRDGRQSAGRFLLASSLPALLLVGVLQWRSGGLFLSYLLSVPGSHPYHFDRVWPGTPLEVGPPLPVVFGALAAVSLWLGMHKQRTFPLPVTTFAPVASGMVFSMFGTYSPPKLEIVAYHLPAGLACFLIGAAPVSIGLYLAGSFLDIRAGRAQGPILSLQILPKVAIVLTAVGLSALMRAHNGGFFNVHIPLYWVCAVVFGILLRHLGERSRNTASLLATAQILWALTSLDRGALTPTEADRAAGERLVEAARAADGDVLSPFAAWIPVYAGKPPSLHYMGVWDLEYKEGPFFQRRGSIEEAVRNKRWALVIGGNQRFGYGLQDHYRSVETLLTEQDPALMPKTGWKARPNRLMLP